MTHKDTSKLFTQALQKVESSSIRDWAQRQRDVWVKGVQHMTFKGDTQEERATALATYITLVAMG